MRGKIMVTDNLEDIMSRLAGCRALLYMLHAAAEVNAISGDALGGVSDLLDNICRYFQADIEAAVDCTEKAATALDPS